METRPKYGNQRTEVDGLTFASKREARRYEQLKLMQRAGAIRDLVLQPRYRLVVNDMTIGSYVADFSYTDTATLRVVVEDAKGVRTPVYRLKKKLMLALWDIDVQEV